VRRLDTRAGAWTAPDAYGRAFCDALGVGEARLPDALRALSELAERSRSGVILWSEPAPNALRTIVALARAQIPVVVVTNSDGHARENLRDAAICQTSTGPGAAVSDVIDSGVVGSAKPDAEIFRVALRRAEVPPDRVVHVGDTVGADVVGARAAGITPIHLDPNRACRAADHRHMRSLAGLWRHVMPSS
jgi:putative hydrolase of the HAD superfamily